MAEFNEIAKWQDAQIDDKTLLQTFASYWENGNYDNAFSLLQDSQLTNKKFVANALNIISVALSYLEDNWFDNVPDYLETQLANFQFAVNQLKVANEFDSTIQYWSGNFVSYNQEWYLCMSKPPIGTLPTNTTYWVALNLDGERGVYGTGLPLKYSWSSTTAYLQYDVVLVGNTMYVAISDNTNHNPATSPTYWQVLGVVPQAMIYTGETAPTAPYEGLIWAKRI